jgi:adenosylhomocysteine nucleosidase
MKKTLLLSLILIQSLYSFAQQPVTAILGAFPPEIGLIHAKMENRKEDTIQHIPFTEGTLNGRRVVLAQTGMGKVNAAITTTLVLEHFKPTEVIFTGIAGGVNPAIAPGDIVIGSKVAYHDYGAITPEGMVIKPTKTQNSLAENPLYFLSSEQLVAVAQEVAKTIKLQSIGTASKHNPQVITGTIVTGDVFVASTTATQNLRGKLNADATEMEGAAVAQTCYQQKVPFLVIRSLSDNASDIAHNDVAQFYQVAANNSAAMVMAIVGKLK